MLTSPLTCLYSGSDRPAWRMNHTGTRSAGHPRQALRKGSLSASTGTAPTSPGESPVAPLQPAQQGAKGAGGDTAEGSGQGSRVDPAPHQEAGHSGVAVGVGPIGLHVGPY